MKKSQVGTDELNEIYRRHSEGISKNGFNRRDFIIFQTALKDSLKKISKLASKERQHFGSGNFSELEDYLEHLQRKVDAALEPEMILTTGLAESMDGYDSRN